MSGSLVQGRRSMAKEVADAIAQEIYCGVLAPNSALASTREIALRYNISHPTVLAACDILEAHGLIVRQERRKIYVKARNAAAQAREILYFSLGGHRRDTVLSRAIYSMIESPVYTGKYDFFTRIVSSPDQSARRNRLQFELLRLEKVGFLDCAVVHAGGLDSNGIKQCLQLPFPVVFLGDLSDEVAAQHPDIWQLRPDPACEVNTMVDYAIMHSYEKVVVFYSEPLQKFRWAREAISALKNRAAKQSLPLRMIDAGAGEPARLDTLARKIREIATGCHGKTLFALCEVNWPEFEAAKIWRHEEFPLIDFISLRPEPEYRAIKYIHYNFEPMCKQLANLMDRAIAKEKPCCEIAKLPTDVVEENISSASRQP